MVVAAVVDDVFYGQLKLPLSLALVLLLYIAGSVAPDDMLLAIGKSTMHSL